MILDRTQTLTKMGGFGSGDIFEPQCELFKNCSLLRHHHEHLQAEPLDQKSCIAEQIAVCDNCTLAHQSDEKTFTIINRLIHDDLLYGFLMVTIPKRHAYIYKDEHVFIRELAAYLALGLFSIEHHRQKEKKAQARH